MTGSRALLRQAWRDARRDRWRTVLIVALVAMPVALLGGAITSFESMAASPQERATDMLGDADAVVRPSWTLTEEASGLAEVRDRLQAELPADSRVEMRAWADGELELPGQRFEVTLTDAPIDGDHLGVGSYRLREGRSPAGDGEVAFTEGLAEHLEVSVGDRLRVGVLGDVEVVGLARRLEYLPERSVLVPPGTLTAPDSGFAPFETGPNVEFLVALPPGMDTTQGLESLDASGRDGQPIAVDEEAAWWVTTREDVLSQRFTEGQRWAAVIIGGLAVVEVALIVGAAFAVSVRRRQRELGLLAAVGATTKHVRRVVLFTGLVAGAVGAVIGTALGLSVAAAASPWFDTIANREVATLRADPIWLGSVAAVGVASTLVGAWWPARSVAKLPVMVALSGRRPPPRPSARGLRVGLAVVVAASLVLAWAVAYRANNPYLFLLGSVLLVLGAGLTSPWLLEQLGRLAPRLPVGPRLAVRDAARFRTRNGPIVTAAMAGLAGAIAIATVVTSMDRHEAATYTPTMAREQVIVHGTEGGAVAERIVAEFGGRHASFAPTDVSLQDLDPAPDDQGVLFGSVALGHPDLAELLGGPAAVEALERGEVVLIGFDAERVLVTRWEQENERGQQAPREVDLAELSAESVPGPEGAVPGYGTMPMALLPLSLAEEVTTFGEVTLIELSSPVDGDTQARMAEIAAEITASVQSEAGPFIEVERGYRSSYATTLIVVLAVGAVTGLALVSIAIALASVEARGDLRTLTAVGADRATRRSLAAGRALLLAGLGGLLAVPVGLIPGAAVLMRMSHVSLVVPWTALVIAVVVVPALATVGAALVSRRDPGPSLRVVA